MIRSSFGTRTASKSASFKKLKNWTKNIKIRLLTSHNDECSSEGELRDEQPFSTGRHRVLCQVSWRGTSQSGGELPLEDAPQHLNGHVEEDGVGAQDHYRIGQLYGIVHGLGWQWGGNRSLGQLAVLQVPEKAHSRIGDHDRQLAHIEHAERHAKLSLLFDGLVQRHWDAAALEDEERGDEELGDLRADCGQAVQISDGHGEEVVEDDADAGHLEDVGHCAQVAEVANVADPVDGHHHGQDGHQADGLARQAGRVADAVLQKLVAAIWLGFLKRGFWAHYLSKVGGNKDVVDAAGAHLRTNYRPDDGQPGELAEASQPLRTQKKGVLCHLVTES